MKLERKKAEEYTRICIEHRMMKYADSLLIHECPDCHKRYAINQMKPMGIDAVVAFIMEIYDRSEVVKMAMICMFISELGVTCEE